MRIWIRLFGIFCAGCALLISVAAVAGHAHYGSGLIAFSSNREELGEIYLMDIEHNLNVNLTHHPGEDTAPDASPDGRYIAFQTSRDSNAEIYLVDMQDFAVHNLTHNSASDMNPDWSPDGQHIA